MKKGKIKSTTLDEKIVEGEVVRLMSTGDEIRHYGFLEEMEMIDLVAGHVFGTDRDRDLIERLLVLTGFPHVRARLDDDDTAYAMELMGSIAERGF